MARKPAGVSTFASRLFGDLNIPGFRRRDDGIWEGLLTNPRTGRADWYGLGTDESPLRGDLAGKLTPAGVVIEKGSTDQRNRIREYIKQMTLRQNEAQKLADTANRLGAADEQFVAGQADPTTTFLRAMQANNWKRMKARQSLGYTLR